MYQPITLFHGEEYAEYSVGFGFGFFSSVGSFVSNAVKTAGREVGHVAHAIQDTAGKVSHAIAEVPIVGGPLHTIFDAAYHSTMGVCEVAVAIAVDGKRIDSAVLDSLKQQVQDFKQVAPYAQMVVSIVPGVGQGVSAALSAGLALSEGQSIDEVIKAGAIGAIPGGPLVKAAVTMGVETMQHVAKGEKVDLATLSQTAGGVASSALGLPTAAKNALMAGMATVGAIASGKPVDKAVTDGAVMALPVSDQVKKAMTEASTLSLDLAHGKRLDHAMSDRINGVVALLPPTNPLHNSVTIALKGARKAGHKPEEILAIGLQSGLADTLVSMGAQPLPAHVQQAIKVGAALGAGRTAQEHRGNQVIKVRGKLTESGVQLSKASPLFLEARKIAASKGATKGFDLAAGLLQQQVKMFDIGVARNSLDATQKIGFDLAMAVRIGGVSHPKPSGHSAGAHAGFAITVGMQSYLPDRKAVLMKAVQSNPSATVGAKTAVKGIAQKREHWFAKLLKALGLRH